MTWKGRYVFMSPAIIQIVPNVLRTLFDVVHPRRGSGSMEAIIFLALAGVLIFQMWTGRADPAQVDRFVDMAIGAILGNGYNRTKNGVDRRTGRDKHKPSILHRY